MQASFVVKNFDVFEDCHLCLFSSFKGLTVNQLSLDRFPEALCYRVVPAITFTAHALETAF